MAEDNNCPVCGQHFDEEEDYEIHMKSNHTDVQETYPEAFNKEEDKIEENEEDIELDVADAGHRSTYSDYYKDKEGADEEGADEPLRKVDDLSENYGKLSTEERAQIFESVGLKQKDAYILANLGWSELTKEIRKDASEAYIEDQDEEEEKAEEDHLEDEDKEEDKAYEGLYNLERKHNSPDYRTKVACENCNILFENNEDLSTHYNDVHAPADEFELEDEEEDDYSVDPLPKGEGYDGI